MNFIFAAVLSAILVSGIKTEAGPLAGTVGYKDGHQQHEYVGVHHGVQHHGAGGVNADGIGSPSGGNVGVGHPILSSQIQDQSSVISQDQIPNSGHVGVGNPSVVGGGSQGVPQFAFVPHHKSDLPLHYGGRAINTPLPYYSQLGKTYASPYYSQYQPAPYGGGYSAPYGGGYSSAVYSPYQYSASPYSASPYSASPYSASPYAASAYSAPVSSPVGGSPYAAYPYNYPYVPQYYQGYQSLYQPSGDVNSVVAKQ